MNRFMKKNVSSEGFWSKIGAALKNAFLKAAGWIKGLFQKLSTRSLIFIAAGVFLLLAVFVTVLFLLLRTPEKPSDSSSSPPDTEAPSTTETEFLVTPIEGVEVEVSADGRSITLYVLEGTVSVDFASMVTAKESWTVMDDDKKILEDGVLPVTENGVSYTVSYGPSRLPYRVTIRYIEFYTVTFEGLDGYTLSVKRGGKAASPADLPEKTGYRFDGWDFDFDSPITENTYVKAKWTPNRYVITFDAAGGSVSPGTLEVTFGASVTLPEPSKTGFTFIGWYAGDRPVGSGTWEIAGDVTLVAAWDNHDYRITYDAAGGYVDKTVQGVSFGEAFTPPTPERVGYTFLGWFVGETPLDSSSYAYTTDVVCVARWAENRYTVHYVTNGGEEIASEALLFSEIGKRTPVRPGYTFGGWYYDPSLSETNIVVGEDGAVTAYAWWQEESRTSDFTFSLEEKGAVITGYRGTKSLCVVPSFIGGLPVVAVGEAAFENAATLVQIVLPETVTELGAGAFAGCSRLEKFNPIENTADSRPVDLEGFSSIGAGAFRGTAFVSVTIPDDMLSLPDELFAECTKLRQVNLNRVTELGAGVFAGCTALDSVTIPDGATSLGADLFRGCTGLLDLSIPSTVSEIGAGAFAGCTSLKAILLPRGLSSLEDELFAGCSALVTIGNLTSDNTALRTIGKYVFADCVKLSAIELPNNLASIGEGAFSGCTALVSMTIPASVTLLEDSLFSGCSRLQTLILRGVVTRIGDNAFSGCRLLSELILSEGLESIGEGAFLHCLSLTRMTLPESLTSIGKDAFSGCVKLQAVNIPLGVTEIPAGVFDGCGALETLTWHDGVTAVGDGAFAGCSLLSLPFMPASLQRIGVEAFRGCYDLQTLTLETALVSIGSRAFADCISLTRVLFKGSAEQWKGAVADDAFEGCTSLGDNIIVTPGIVDDLAPWLLANPSSGALWAIDNTLPMNGKRPAAVLAFAPENLFFNNLILTDPENADPVTGASVNPAYTWEMVVAGQTLTISSFEVYNFGGYGYVILDLGEEFIPAAGVARYAASLTIYGSAGEPLYQAELGECIFRNAVLSLTEDPSREESDPLGGFTLSSGPSLGMSYGAENLFDSNLDTRFFSQDRTPIVISFEEKVRLTSYSFITSPAGACYPEALPSGWTLYGGAENEDGEWEWVEVSRVESAGFSAESWVEHNINVEHDTAYRQYMLVFDGEGPLTLSEIMFFGNAVA